MEVSSVSSGLIGALNASAQARVFQSEQTQQPKSAPSVSQSGQLQSAQQVQGNASVDESESAARSRSETESARPSVNINGQVVGTRINTTA